LLLSLEETLMKGFLLLGAARRVIKNGLCKEAALSAFLW
jgi:hypothetical protein